jgi:hypothetical protein
MENFMSEQTIEQKFNAAFADLANIEQMIERNEMSEQEMLECSVYLSGLRFADDGFTLSHFDAETSERIKACSTAEEGLREIVKACRERIKRASAVRAFESLDPSTAVRQ